MLKKTLLGGLIVATSLIAMTSAWAKDLRVATNSTFPPFEFMNSKTQELTGFEIDLIKAMTKKAGYEFVPVKLGFDAIIPAILSGTVDVGASGFSVTEERKKRVLFTEPFYQSGLSILVSKENEGKIKNFDDLKGKKVAVQLGSTSASVAKTIPDGKVKTFNHSSEAILDLNIGGVDAAINDKPVTDYILMQQPHLKNTMVELPQLLQASGMAMVISKKNPELKAQLDKAFDELKADGTYAKLYKKWFGQLPPAAK